METIVRQMIADSMELAIPVLTPRRGALPELPDAASVVIGMRRTGKTYRMFQKMRELLDMRRCERSQDAATRSPLPARNGQAYP